MRSSVLAGIVLVAACATTSSTGPASSDDLSAAEHRKIATAERARADDAYARWEPGSRVPLPTTPGSTTDAPRMFPIDLFPYNPTDRALADAEWHLRHAREHEAAAAALEGFEDAQCREIPAKARAACPLLGPVATIDDRLDGVRITFATDADVDAIVAHMRCHLAFARAKGFGDAGDCPLYMRGVEINVAIGGRAIDVTSGDAYVARQIQIRSRQTSSFERHP
jgi:hypothetical protein